MAKKNKVGDRSVFGFKMFIALLVSMLKIANLLKNLLTSIDVAKKDEMGK